MPIIKLLVTLDIKSLNLNLNELIGFVEVIKRYLLSCIAKFQDLYNLGVRKFALLNDDFPSGSHDQVVTFINRLQTEFIEPKGCDNLIYCMDGYYGNGNQAELAAMRNLDSSVELFWTGAGVNAPITQTTVDYVRDKTNHDSITAEL